MQDVFDFTMGESDKNHMTKFSLTGRQENNCHENSDVLENIARLYEDACNAEDETIKANQAKILCWCNFIIGLDKSVDEIMIKEKVGMKKANTCFYIFRTLKSGVTKK